MKLFRFGALNTVALNLKKRRHYCIEARAVEVTFGSMFIFRLVLPYLTHALTNQSLFGWAGVYAKRQGWSDVTLTSLVGCIVSFYCGRGKNWAKGPKQSIVGLL